MMGSCESVGLKPPGIVSQLFFAGALAACFFIGAYAGRDVAIRLVPFMAVALAVGIFSRSWFLRAFLIVLPLGGMLSRHAGTHGLPATLLLFYAGLLGAAFRGQRTFHFPLRIVVYVGGLLFSFLIAVARVVPSSSLTTPVASGPWGGLGLGNALGWIVLALLMAVAGPLLYDEIQTEFTDLGGRARLLIWLALCVIVPALVGVLQYAHKTTFNIDPLFLRGGRPQYNATFLDPNSLGIAAMLLLPIFLAWSSETGFSFLRVLPATAVLALIYISASRSGFLGAAIALVVLLAALTIRRPRTALVLVMLVGASFALFRYDQVRRFQDSSRVNYHVGQVMNVLRGRVSARALIAERKIQWRSGWTTFKHMPLVGTGLGAYLIHMPRYQREIGEIVNDNAGSQYLQIAAEQGLVGVMIFLFLIGSFVVEFLIFHRFDVISFGAFAALCGVAVAFFFGAHINNFETAQFFWIALAVLSPRPSMGDK